VSLLLLQLFCGCLTGPGRCSRSGRAVSRAAACSVRSGLRGLSLNRSPVSFLMSRCSGWSGGLSAGAAVAAAHALLASLSRVCCCAAIWTVGWLACGWGLSGLLVLRGRFRQSRVNRWCARWQRSGLQHMLALQLLRVSIELKLVRVCHVWRRL
jgi:hypothetical protein